jgi:hypothetical protein
VASSRLVAFGAAGKIASSVDGINWVQGNSSFGSSDIRSVSYASNGVYASAGADGKLATSFDGVGWVIRPSSFGTSTINGIHISLTRSIAVGDSGKISLSV